MVGKLRARAIASISIVVAVLAGAATALGFFTFGYADGTSYLTNDPNACANCHVMRGHLDAWVKSSHSKFAKCNDCHAPHSLLPKMYCKARNGFFHSLAFTTGKFPDNMQPTDYNRKVTEQACRSCHEAVMHQIDDYPTGEVSCIRCHATVGHDD